MKKVITREPNEIRLYLREGYKVISIGYFCNSISPQKYLFTLTKEN